MSTDTPFMPRRGGNKKVNATTTSATVVVGAGEKSLRVANAATSVIYFRTFDSTNETGVTATAADTPVLPASAASSTLIIEKPVSHDSVAFLAEAGTTNPVHFQPGEGLS